MGSGCHVRSSYRKCQELGGWPLPSSMRSGSLCATVFPDHVACRGRALKQRAAIISGWVSFSLSSAVWYPLGSALILFLGPPAPGGLLRLAFFLIGRTFFDNSLCSHPAHKQCSTVATWGYAVGRCSGVYLLRCRPKFWGGAVSISLPGPGYNNLNKRARAGVLPLKFGLAAFA